MIPVPAIVLLVWQSETRHTLGRRLQVCAAVVGMTTIASCGTWLTADPPLTKLLCAWACGGLPILLV